MEMQKGGRELGKSQVPDLQMLIALRHRSTWPSLHLRWTSRRWPNWPEGCMVWICRRWRPWLIWYLELLMEGRPVGGIQELDLLLEERFILYRKAIDHLIIRSSTGTLKRTNILELQADIISAGHKSHRRLRSF